MRAQLLGFPTVLGLPRLVSEARPAAVVPGHSEKSPLIEYVSGKVPESEMPPRAVRERFPALTTDEIAVLRAWIDQGAEWPLGVSLTPPWIENQR
jgi:hypothetical protein